MAALKNKDGTIIAWVFRNRERATCENDNCIKAISEGRLIHVIPAHTDPRAANGYLVMPTYHFATLPEVVKALDEAWDTAETVHTRSARDAERAKNVPVIVAHDIDLEQ
jgi:hypothetical protein